MGYIKTIKAEQGYKETKILKLDSTKAQSVLNWRRLRTLEDTIKLTAEFMKKEKQGANAGSLCREQVHGYLEGIR